MAGIGLLLRRRAVVKEVGLNDYIMDSPLLWLDGIKKGTNQNAWTDHAGGYVFKNFGATELNNGWLFSGNGYMQNSENNLPVLLPGGANGRTLEVVADFSKSISVQPIFINNKNGDVSFGISGGNYVFTAGEGKNGVYMLKPSGNTITHTAVIFQPGSKNTSGYENGVALSRPSTNISAWSLGSVAIIGASGTKAYLLKGTIYAIRFHDRILSYEEILHNMEIDSERFKLSF